MPNRRKGAPGSFGAPLEELLPRFGGERDATQIKVDVHRAPDLADDSAKQAERCRIFLLNQSLYERARK